MESSETVEVSIVRCTSNGQPKPGQTQAALIPRDISLKKLRSDFGIPQVYAFIISSELPIAGASQERYTVGQIMVTGQKGRRQVQLWERKNDPTQNEKSKSLKSKSEKKQMDPELVKKAISDLDEYCASCYAEGNVTLEKKRARLEKAKETLSLVDSAFLKIDVDKYLTDIYSFLNSSESKLSNEFINQLQVRRPMTDAGILAENGKVFLSWHKEFQNPFGTVVDFSNSQIKINNQGTGSQKIDEVYFSKSAYESVAKKIDQQIISLKGGISFTPLKLIKACISYNSQKRSQNSQKQSSADQRQYQLHYGVHVAKGLAIDKQSIALRQVVKDDYTELFDQYQACRLNPHDKHRNLNLKERIEKFVHTYGSMVEVGTYYFGAKYKATTTYHFNAWMSQAQRKKIMDKQGHLTVQGSKFLRFAFSAKGSGDYEKVSGSMGHVQDANSSYHVSRTYDLNPYITCFDEWIETVILCPQYWQVLAQETHRVQLSEIMRNPLNRIADHDDPGAFLRFCDLVKDVNYEVFDNVEVKSQRQVENGTYVGQWRGNRKHGNGLFTSNFGWEYKGDWVDDEMNGLGTLTNHIDGTVYQGEFRHGQQHGFGVYQDETGRKYEGQWKNGKMHGPITQLYANGNVYKGTYREGKRHGHGTMRRKDGTVNQEYWENGCLK